MKGTVRKRGVSAARKAEGKSSDGTSSSSLVRMRNPKERDRMWKDLVIKQGLDWQEAKHVIVILFYDRYV